MDRDESQRGTEAADTADWEAVALDRVRGRVERTDTDAADAGWEAAALARLRAHFERDG